MTYYAVSQLSRDSALLDRITACAVIEGQADPEGWAYTRRWQLAAAPGWREAYAYALAGDKKDPGIDPSVISDGMILAAVQALRLQDTATPEGTTP